MGGAPVYPPLLPFDQAQAIRKLCLHAAWHAANKQVGYDEDASRDLEALNQIKLCISDSSVRSGNLRSSEGSDLAEDLERLVLSAAWHAVHTLNED